jgi:hypothetical protein
MNGQCDTRQTTYHFRCCDAVVIAMGLVVALGSIFRPELTFLFAGQ